MGLRPRGSIKTAAHCLLAETNIPTSESIFRQTSKKEIIRSALLSLRLYLINGAFAIDHFWVLNTNYTNLSLLLTSVHLTTPPSKSMMTCSSVAMLMKRFIFWGIVICLLASCIEVGSGLKALTFCIYHINS